jgi:uncharacterized coiled-coil DUF342 family protein
MTTKKAKWVIAIAVMAILATFFLVAATPALGQSEQEGDQESEIPPELEQKKDELKSALKELRENLEPLRSQARDLRGEKRDFRREEMDGLREDVNRWREEAQELEGEERFRFRREKRSQLREDVSQCREEANAFNEALGPYRIIAEGIRQSVGAIKEDIATAREAWSEEDLEAALSFVDEALKKIEVLNQELKDFNQTLES